MLQARRLIVVAALILAPILVYRATTAAPPAPTTPATAPAAADSTRFLRFVDDGHDGGKLQTSIVTYRSPAGVVVHLVGAVHIGEKGYYQALAKTFAGYDALLYELVKSRGARPPRPGEKSASGVSAVQRWLKNSLDLDFQLDAIDYQAANFVHADLDAETFFKMQADRGESILGLMLQAMLKQMSREMADDGTGLAAPPPSIVDLLAALSSTDRAREMKLLLAKQFNDIEDSLSGLTGPDGSVLVTERNKAALRVLTKTIDGGKRNIGIFYGAAHMPDLEKRLLAMGFKPDGPPEWRVAWDLTNKTPATGPALTPLEKIIQAVDRNRAAQEAARRPAK